MAGDDDPGSQRGRLDLQPGQIVDHEEKIPPTRRDSDSPSRPPIGSRSQVTALHCRDGGDPCEFNEDAWITDVPGVHDVVTATKEGPRFRPEKSVSVRDEAHAKGALLGCLANCGLRVWGLIRESRHDWCSRFHSEFRRRHLGAGCPSRLASQSSHEVLRMLRRGHWTGKPGRNPPLTPDRPGPGRGRFDSWGKPHSGGLHRLGHGNPAKLVRPARNRRPAP